MPKTANIYVRVEPGITVKLPQNIPPSYDTITKEEFDREIQRGMDDIEAGKTYSIEEVRAELKRDYGI